jgi:hypothetical protein
VDIGLLPDAIKARVKKERGEEDSIKIGLLLAWAVIAAFTDDPLGVCFQHERNALRTFLSVRNQSLFAHGATPIGERAYQQHAPRVQTFVRKAVDSGIAALGRKRVVTLLQLPAAWE